MPGSDDGSTEENEGLDMAQSSPAAASKARARALHAQIESIKREHSAPLPAPGKESPRDFIARRMAQLSEE
ncbi:hypothetical protein GON01_04970 [Sphingomonas sp. MAH-20]|uniref:Uncharacterized protein n=1 Tax=Sphingomonas horti TaxID=2682842 RepID=A0A6I4J125_9SPHN|nr:MULTISPECIES: hypothetical protein [Sphingomonas]MBA2918324.1 hypothetical protein [Sphingomonas sp. CGMCC 1.13658]MVO77291.1 hypothetical protein [Sphingomonas horti]